jgi:hypothetical protein
MKSHLVDCHCQLMTAGNSKVIGNRQQDAIAQIEPVANRGVWWRGFAPQDGAKLRHHTSDLLQAAENSMLSLILAGAAVYRCDKWLVFRGGF